MSLKHAARWQSLLCFSSVEERDDEAVSKNRKQQCDEQSTMEAKDARKNKKDERGDRQGRDEVGEGGGGRCVMVAKWLQIHHELNVYGRQQKERRREINEKERETASTEQPDVESRNQKLWKT